MAVTVIGERECPRCAHTSEYDDSDVILMPWPHVVCPLCGEWIPLF